MPNWLSNLRPAIIDQCLHFTQALLPQQCLLCAAESTRRPVCDPCYAHLPVLTGVRCPQCAIPTPHGEICGACLADPPAFNTVSAAFQYAWPLATLIQQFKYSGTLALARVLAESIAATEPAAVDLIVPMPLGPARLRERGFNQALELARFVGALTRTPVGVDTCRRVDDRPPQASLPWRERAKNIRGAFVYNDDLSGKRIAVVDDVMTTGATLHEIARTLRKAGAIEVHCWVVARTLKKE